MQFSTIQKTFTILCGLVECKTLDSLHFAPKEFLKKGTIPFFFPNKKTTSFKKGNNYSILAAGPPTSTLLVPPRGMQVRQCGVGKEEK